VDGAILPAAFESLAASDLADQIETVKLSPHSLAPEDLSKLWTAFQAKYRPSAAYVATVVLIQRTDAVRSALPVLTRGPVDPQTGKERGVVVQPGLIPPYPALTSAVPESGEDSVRMGERLILTGAFLDGDRVTVRFLRPRDGAVFELDPEVGGTGTELRVRVPPDPPEGTVDENSALDPTRWASGVHAVAVRVGRGAETDRDTNAVAVGIAPTLGDMEVTETEEAVSIEVEVTPPVWSGQTARLLVGSVEAAAEPFEGETASGLTFISSEFPEGEQWVRLRIDGVDSFLVRRSGSLPVFDETQRVTIP
jgi:hypothetical protein